MKLEDSIKKKLEKHKYTELINEEKKIDKKQTLIQKGGFMDIPESRNGTGRNGTKNIGLKYRFQITELRDRSGRVMGHIAEIRDG